MKIAVVMNPISNIDFKKDSTLLLIYEAQKRNHDVFYIESNNLFFDGKDACALSSKIEVKMDPKSWFSLDEENRIFLKDLDVIFMRQDPPFDMGYINNTYVLDSAENDGVRIYNKPSSLRNFNEKISILEYLEFCTETIVTSDKNLILNFIEKYKDVVAKPLNLMGGQGIEKINFNQNDLIDKLKKVSKDFKEKIMVQKFIERVYEGDKRILVINGRPSEYAVVRTPAMGEFKGNLAAESLSRANITCNKNGIPFDTEKPMITSGIRLGTQAATTRGFGLNEFKTVGELITKTLKGLSENPNDNSKIENEVKKEVIDLTSSFPIYKNL